MGAIAALKGYRTQFLYSLYRILSDYSKGYNFHVEGKYEDLDIIDENGNYIEAIQIKNQTEKLNFSDLFSKKTSLFKRVEKMVLINHEAKVKLVSFGNVSDELNNTKILSKKLIGKNFNKDNVNKVLQNFSVEIINEDYITSKILEKLKELSVFSDPTIALELLIYWIYQLAETNKPIQAKQLIINLERIGNFINQQKNFNHSFFNTIIPLSTKSLESADIDLHKKNFYYGASAKYEHILANLDVIRKDKLIKINEAFKNKDVVIIYGASGQGKSTLAYRYLKEFTSSNTAYELKISQSLEEVYKVINSLESLSKGLNFPVTLYIDVPPQNLNWNEIIKELNGKKNLKFLVTIRQEDWNKTSNLQQFYDFEDIELIFDKEEAKYIYENLTKIKEDLQFTDFEESWKVFGNKGLLLEYTYLINQGNTLKSKLNEQIQNLRNLVSEKKTEELEILRYVALSDSFNSRISYKRLIYHLKIKEPLKYIKDLEKEYLIQYSEDGEYLKGLHPIRSKIITDILFEEDIYTNIFDYINSSLHLVNEEDLLNFLLFSFSRGYDPYECKDNIKSISLKSWTGFINIFNAFLWKGIFDYMMKTNEETFNEAYDLYGKAWYLLLNFVLTEDMLFDDDSFILKNKPDNFLIKNSELRNKITNKQQIYNYCINWVKSINTIETIPTEAIEWKSFGQFFFWVKHLKLKTSFNIKDDYFKSFFLESIDNTEEQAIVLLGLKSIKYKKALIKKLENDFIKNVRLKFNVIFFNIKNNEIDTIYIYNFFEKNKSKGLNGLSISLIDLMRKGFPEIDVYKTKCYGHNIAGIKTELDDSIKRIPNKNFHIDFFIQINVLFNNIFSYSRRPDSWKEYINILQKNRIHNLEAVKNFRTGLIKYFKNNSEGINYFVNNISNIEKEINSIRECELPKLVSDRWGYYGDNDDNNINIENRKSFASEKYINFNNFKNDYFSPVSTFLITTAFKEITNTFHRLSGNVDKIDNHNNRNITEINLFTAVINLFKFQKEFEKLFLKYYDETEEKKIKIEEMNTLISVFTIWKKFLHSKQRTLKASELSLLTLEKTKIDFKLNLSKSTKLAFKGTNCFAKIDIDEENRILYFYMNVNFDNYNHVIFSCLSIVLDTFGNLHHTSLKKILIDLNYEKVVIVPLYNGNPINHNFIIIEIPMIKIMKDKIDNNEIDNLQHLITIPSEKDIKIFNDLGLIFWNKIIPEISLIENSLGHLESLKYYMFHIKDLLNSIDSLDNMGKFIFETYTLELSSHIHYEIIEPINLDLKQVKDYILNTKNIELKNLIFDYTSYLKKLNDGFTNTKNYVLTEDFAITIQNMPSSDNLNSFNRYFLEQ